MTDASVERLKELMTDFTDDLKVEERLLTQAKLDNTKAELTAARTLIKGLQADIERLERVHDFLKTDLEKEPAWLKAPVRKTKDERGIVCTLLSDLHLDEVVDPSEMQGRNAYNREIAELRLKRYFDQIVKQATHYHQGTKYDGCVVLLGGDLVSGGIHDELRESNEGTVADTIRFWTPKIGAGLEYLANEFGNVRVASVPGNHGRFTHRARFKKRAHDNADWLISALLAERFASDKRFAFDVPDSMDAHLQVYDTRFLLTHGDQASGGGGIGGIWPPIMRLKARKQANFEFDWMVIGHWHQYVHSQGITVNGSLKGWDEFAFGMNFQYEKPSQAMWIVTPERGVTWPVQIFVEDRKKEGW